ncbi:MAG: hypothetical protein R3313_00470 [Candidatus Saccharimonadales bacterium]|nr:hypothetical protein [Candidatus Saccharimonadales bacterium]
MPHAPEIYPDATPVGNNPYLLDNPEALDGAPPAGYLARAFEELAEEEPESKLKLQRIAQDNQELRLQFLYGEQVPGEETVEGIKK